MSRRIAAAALLACAGVLAALGAAEAVLRVSHFEFRAIPEIQFGWPEPEVIRTDFKSDPDLVWVLPDYQQRLTHARTTHPDLIFLGDSCIEFSDYPQFVVGRLENAHALATAEKLAVPGWSSEQGRTQVIRDLPAVGPRVVVVEYGWNDHWDALGPSDDHIHPSALEQWAADHLRIYQAYRKAAVGLAARRHSEVPRRVSLDRYRDNLRTIVRTLQRGGARVVLVTAPSGHEPGREPEYLRARHLRELSALIPLHETYVRATREVAAETGAILCDAAAAIARAGPARGQYFRSDGIHFSHLGDEFMSELVAGCVSRAIA